jgi:hypothetical protein
MSKSIRKALSKVYEANLDFKNIFLQELKRVFGNRFDYRMEGDVLVTRYLGKWENPPEAEDDEDYDWQEPTKDTADKIVSLVQSFESRYPVKITPQGSEKCYIDFKFNKA